MRFRKPKRALRLRRQSNNEMAPKAVFSYYSNRSEQKTPNIARQKSSSTSKWQFIKQLPIYLASGAIILCIGYLFTLSSNPKILIFNESKLPAIRSQNEYSRAAHDLLDSSLVNKTKITIATNKLESSLKNRFPELSNVAVTVPIMGRRPVVKLEISPAVLIIRTAGEDYLLSSEGRAIIAADKSSSNTLKNLPLVVDQSDLQIQAGEKVLTSSAVSFIDQLITQFRAKNLTISALTLPPLASELHIKIKGAPYFVKFDLLGDVRLQAGSFIAVKRSLESQGKTPLQYIDVRVEGKVYYK